MLENIIGEIESEEHHLEVNLEELPEGTDAEFSDWFGGDVS